jgi:hypothetical protein
MNKLMKGNIQEEASKVKSCLLGQVSSDINARLPEKPPVLNNWEKYKLLKSGKAKLQMDIPLKSMMATGSSSCRLLDSFIYPKSKEQVAYEKAFNAIHEEKNDRELAAENAIRHLVAQALLETIPLQDFLKGLDQLSSQKW